MKIAANAADIVDSLDDFRIEKIEVPEWNLVVHIRTMSAKAHDDFDSSITDSNGNVIQDGIHAKILSSTLCDESGNCLFSIKDVEKLAKKSSTVIRRLADRAIKLNRINKGADAEKKDDSDLAQTVSSQ